MDQNEFEAMSELLSISAYHYELNEAGQIVDVFLNLSILKTDFGGDGVAPIEFTASLKEVNVEAIISGTSGLIINEEMSQPIYRDVVSTEEAQQKQTKRTTKKSVALKAKEFFSGSASVASESQSETGSTNALKEQQALPLVNLSRGKRGQNRRYLRLRATDNGRLTPDTFFDGGIFDERHKQPVVAVRDMRTQDEIDLSIKTNTQPDISLVVNFKRKNLNVVITKVHDKKGAKRLASKNTNNAQNKRRAAAECYLRDLLIERGLKQSPFWADNTSIIIAEITAQPQPKIRSQK